jgi:hypothetical protein
VIEFSRQIFVKYSTINYRENEDREMDRREDRDVETNKRILQFCEAPRRLLIEKNIYIIVSH